MNRIWCRLYLRHTVGKHLARSHLNESYFWLARSSVARRTLFNSMCLVLRVEPLRLVIPSAAEDSQHRIWRVVVCVSSALRPNFSGQFHCCLWSMTPQAPDNAVTNSAPPLLSAPMTHFLNRSASPAESESPRSHLSLKSSFDSFKVECRRPHCYDSMVSTEVSQD